MLPHHLWKLSTLCFMLCSTSLSAQQATASPGPSIRNSSVDSVAARLGGELRRGGRAVVPEIRFSGPTDTLTAASDVALRALARTLHAMPGVFLIESHTGSSGDIGADLARTDRRAAVVKARLLEYGVAPSRLVTMGYGATKPPAASPNGQLPSAERIEVSRAP